MEFHGHDVSQCDQVNRALNSQPWARGIDCCSVANVEDCNKTGWPDFASYGFRCDTSGPAPLPWDTIEAQIALRRPFTVTEVTDDHVMAGVGCEVISSVRWVVVNEPRYGIQEWIPYDEYSRVARGHNDLYNIRQR